jgi:methylmalonyl-CoA mutase cobalamin-binding subunit
VSSPTPSPASRTEFCRARGVAHELEFKRRARDAGRITYHMHVGLTDWPATEAAVRFVHDGLRARGHAIERFGLCLDRAMGLPPEQREQARRETGPRLQDGDWAKVAALPVQPHLGDHMIGTPAGEENARAALAAGITSIGNLGQFFAFEPPGGYDDAALTQATVRALREMARTPGALVHSYLDDGPAVQFSHYGGYVGWAALELYVVEALLGARLAHSYGGLIPDPDDRAIVGFALDDLRGRDSIGTMVYGNTVDYTADHTANERVLRGYLTVDIGAQLHRPTGHAINPVPLTEAERIPSAEEILEVQLIAREVEREARRLPSHWAPLEAQAARLAADATAFRDRVLSRLDDEGVEVRDPEQVLLALRRTQPAALDTGDGRPTWKAGLVARESARIARAAPRFDGTRVLLAVLEVHDVIRDALATALTRQGADVIVLAGGVTPAEVAAAATQEDVDAVVVGSYNGGALSLARELRAGFDGLTIFGGVLNEDTGGELPVDARPGLRELGIVCLDDAAEVGPVLSRAARSGPRPGPRPTPASPPSRGR